MAGDEGVRPIPEDLLRLPERDDRSRLLAPGAVHGFRANDGYAEHAVLVEEEVPAALPLDELHGFEHGPRIVHEERAPVDPRDAVDRNRMVHGAEAVPCRRGMQDVQRVGEAEDVGVPAVGPAALAPVEESGIGAIYRIRWISDPFEEIRALRHPHALGDARIDTRVVHAVAVPPRNDIGGPDVSLVPRSGADAEDVRMHRPAAEVPR